MLTFVQSSVVHVRDEAVLNKQKEPGLGPTLKKENEITFARGNN